MDVADGTKNGPFLIFLKIFFQKLYDGTKYKKMIEKSCSYFQFMEKNYLEGLLLHKNSETVFV